jgi:hypothetical protein
MPTAKTTKNSLAITASLISLGMLEMFQIKAGLQDN